ncbi:MAG: undecaprenyl-diphosphate phosphatase [Candidatus Bathyarchaeota archaeon]|nr:undecaprenyl-diphosphate phosphatase [Candidatus Bathyarchaeota archaeon]
MPEQLLQVLFLGLLQGITEWLPISSTAHLKLIDNLLLNLSTTPLFNLVLHIGTLTAVVFFFRKDIQNMLSALIKFDFKSESGALIPPIAVATIPTAIIGLIYVLLKGETFQTLPIIAVTFLVGATIVYSSRFGQEKTEKISYKNVVLIGIAQGFAVFPGLSRSGVTISTALLLGLRREKAFKFSFLLSIPAIIGDFVVELYNQRGVFATTGIDPINIIAGFAVAVVGGYLALKLVAQTIRSKKFHYFAIYTATIGTILLISSILIL